MDSTKTHPNLQCQLARRRYIKALMQIIEVENEGFFTASGAATRQVESFKKESTDDWF